MSDPQIHVENRQIAIPGTLLGEGIPCSENCYKKDGKTYSLIRGLCRVDGKRVSIIPLSGAYTPKTGDFIVGHISDDFGSVYLVNMNSPFYAVLRDSPGRGNERNKVDWNVGDIVNAKIISVDEVKEAQLASPWKLSGGYTINVDPKKIPRIIGKKKSMINLVKEKTGCKIFVGQNGLIWIDGPQTKKAVKALKMIEKEAHTRGLTDRMTQLLSDIKNF